MFYVSISSPRQEKKSKQEKLAVPQQCDSLKTLSLNMSGWEIGKCYAWQVNSWAHDSMLT